jgi:hypothetical protein
VSSHDKVEVCSPEELVRSVIESTGRAMKRNNEQITTEELVGRAICAGKAPHCSKTLFVEIAREYVDKHTEDDPEGLDVDHRADEGREVCLEPHRRRHRHYQQPRWSTAHVRGVDNVFATGDKEEIRIDLDGVGSGGASLHDTDENVNLSVWFDHSHASELLEQLRDATRDMRPVVTA